MIFDKDMHMAVPLDIHGLAAGEEGCSKAHQKRL